MRSSNPMLRDSVWQNARIIDRGETMTVAGTAAKTLLLFIVMLMPAVWTCWKLLAGGSPALLMPLVWGGMLGGLVLAIVTVFKPAWAPVTAPIYAICQGFVIGFLSTVFEAMYPGVVVQAVALTFGVAAVMFAAFSTGLLKPTQGFRAFVVAATGGLMLVYLVSIALSFFGRSIPFIHESGMWGIIFSLVAIGIAALNLILDFGFIAAGAQQGAPKQLEWYGAFGLLVTLLWLYIELLRLLGKLRRR